MVVMLNAVVVRTVMIVMLNAVVVHRIMVVIFNVAVMTMNLLLYEKSALNLSMNAKPLILKFLINNHEIHLQIAKPTIVSIYLLM